MQLRQSKRPYGDIIIADGHWPRPSTAQQDGDRLVRHTEDGKVVRDYGKLGRGPGEFMGPHALAVDSQGRLFVADRSNSRVQIFDRDLNYLDLSADDAGNIFAGLTTGCQQSKSGGCVQKWISK